MVRYSTELKEEIVKKMMPPNNRSVAEISRETGISTPTLYAWKKQFQEQGHVVPARAGTPEGWDAKARLAAIIQTASMNEHERSVYCREKGLYVEQLEQWRDAFESIDSTGTKADKAELAAQRKKNRRLKKELRRKESALAQAAALLTLSKKAQAIWGIDEED